MKRASGFLFLRAIFFWFVLSGAAFGQDNAANSPADLSGQEIGESAPVRLALSEEGSLENEEIEPMGSPAEAIPDPLEPLNRAFFEFNDRLYFWVLKPVATGYKTVVPEEIRMCGRNFFNNLAFPVRFVNNLLQGKFFGAFEETCGFLVNTTLGLGGLADVSKAIELKTHEEDLGQTLAVYGAGPAFYIHWPFLGPSTLRETIGKVGDSFLDPLSYLDTWYSAGAKGLDTLNETSFRIGDYESFKKAALDPYVALRDAYYQNRLSRIKE